MQAKCDFGLHVGQFFLDQLGLCQWLSELHAVQRVLAGTKPAIFSRAQCAPGNAVACLVQATEWAFEAADVGQYIGFRHKHIVHDDFAGDGGTQAHFSLDLRRCQAFHAYFEDKAVNRLLPADVAIRVSQLGPDDEHIGNRAVGDPHFGALEHEAAVHRLGTRQHAGRVRAMVGLCQSKAANPFAGGQFRQIFFFLRVAAIGVDRMHDQ